MADFLHYTIPTKADGSLPPADIVAIYAALEASAAAVLAHAEAQFDPSARANTAMVGFAAEVLSRCKAWAWFHYSRANERELPAGAEAFVHLAETLELLQETVANRGLSDSIVWAAGKAYSAAFGIAAKRSEAGFYAEAAFDQECETEESFIRSLVWSLALINDRLWQMSEGFMTPTEAHFSAIEIFIEAPVPPPTAEEETF